MASQRKPRSMNTGYVRVFEPEHPLANRDGYVLQHRKVAWDAGLMTDRRQHVHHINGVKTDNRVENLEATDERHHHREHVRRAGMVTNQYGTFPVRTPTHAVLCEWCGQPYRMLNPRQRFCSKSCASFFRVRRTSAR